MRWLTLLPDETVLLLRVPKFDPGVPCRTVASVTAVVVAGVAVTVQVRYGVRFCDVRVRLAANAEATMPPRMNPTNTTASCEGCIVTGRRSPRRSVRRR